MMRPRSVGPGVESFAARTPTLPPATHTESYALGEREVILVEPATPFEDEQREWLAWARGQASKGRDVVAIFLTHHHPDHAGGAEFLARELRLPLWAHRETASRVAVRIDRALEDGEALVLEGPGTQRWEVLHTPGHAPGHLCLFERTLGHVVVGDMVASTGTILIAPGDGDMQVYLEQLERLAVLGARTALPAHGDPIAEPDRHFRHYIAHRLAREGRVLSALEAAGPVGATLSALLPLAYADTPEAVWPLARLSLEAHLEKLVREGRASVSEERYHPAHL